MNIKLTDKEKIKVNDPEDLFFIMQRILLRDNKIDQEKEHFWIIGLNNASYILYIELVSLGSVRSTLVEPMNVFRVAVLKGATKVMAVHNHPSGTMIASEADKDLTDRLIQVGRILDIILIDHLIISTKTFMSFRNSGLMEKLEASTKYVPPYVLVDKIRKEEQALKAEAVKREKDLRKKEKELREKEQQLRLKMENELIKTEKEYSEYKKALAHTLFEKGLPHEKIEEILKSISEETKQSPNE